MSLAMDLFGDLQQSPSEGIRFGCGLQRAVQPVDVPCHRIHKPLELTKMLLQKTLKDSNSSPILLI